MSKAQMRSGTVRVEGATLRYLIEGSGIPTLVVGSSLYYPRTFPQRLREAFCMAFVDVRHFAENDGSLSPDRISVGTYVEDIESVRTHLGMDSAILIGHSHHGNLALEYAKRYPARVSHLVLIGSPPLDVRTTVRAAEAYWESHASRRRKAILRDNLAALDAKGLERMTPAQAYVIQYVAEGPKYWCDAACDATHLWQEMPVDMGIIKAFREFFAGPYRLHWDPDRLTAPVLVVMGRHDYVVPHILWDEVRPTLRNLTFHLFEHSGHTPQMEEPGHFDRVLRAWVRQEAAVAPMGTARTLDAQVPGAYDGKRNKDG